MALQVAVACALLALCLARPDSPPSYFYGAPSHDSSEESVEVKPPASAESLEDYGPAKYDFNYAVKDDDSGNDFGHQEIRDGDRTDGSYYVQLPDGRLQKVTYYVEGDSGYVAEVTYEGEAHYPEPDSVEVHSSEPDSVEVHSSEPDSVETEQSEADSSEESYAYAPPPPPPSSLYGAPQ